MHSPIGGDGDRRRRRQRAAADRDAGAAHDSSADESRARCGAQRRPGRGDHAARCLRRHRRRSRRRLARRAAAPLRRSTGRPRRAAGHAPPKASTTLAHVRVGRGRRSTSVASRDASLPAAAISYVPGRGAGGSHRCMLRAIGGFDESLRTGEDVDMVWRLIDGRPPLPLRAGFARFAIDRDRRWSAWARQRVAYGRSAAALDRKHPGAVAPLRISGWSAAVWALVFARRPIAGIGGRPREPSSPCAASSTTFPPRSPSASPASVTSTPAGRWPARSPASGGRSP